MEFGVIMNNKWKAILLVTISTVIAAFGQVLWKISSEAFSLTVEGTILNLPLIGGFVAHGIQLGLLVLALRRAELTIIYPIVSLGFVWVFILSLLFFGEQIIIENWIGVFAIISGVVFITRAAK